MKTPKKPMMDSEPIRIQKIIRLLAELDDRLLEDKTRLWGKCIRTRHGLL
jgi:hypothetical protein